MVIWNWSVHVCVRVSYNVFNVVLCVLGGAGVGGALAYTGLSTFLSPRDSLLIQLVIPIVMLIRCDNCLSLLFKHVYYDLSCHEVSVHCNS